MEVEGRGEIWLADLAKNVFITAGDGLSVAGKSVLCFDSAARVFAEASRYLWFWAKTGQLAPHR
jgi:hypothetical protein